MLLKPSGQIATINNTQAGLYFAQNDTSGANEYYLSDENDWTMARMGITAKTIGLMETLDIRYNRDVTGIVVPASWELKRRFKSSPASVTKKFTVAEYKINHDISDDSFEYKFPVGTSVFDDEYSKLTSGIVQPDGQYKPHPDTPPEIAKRNDEEYQAKQSRPLFYLLAIGGVVAVLVTLVLYRYLRNKS